MIKNEKIDAMLEAAEVQTLARPQLCRDLAYWSKWLGGTNDSEEEVLIQDSGKKVYLFNDSAMLVATVGAGDCGYELRVHVLKNIEFIKVELDGFEEDIGEDQIPSSDVRIEFRIAGNDFTIHVEKKCGRDLIRILKTKLIPAM